MVGKFQQEIECLEETLLENALAFLRRGIEETKHVEGKENAHQILSFAVVDIAVALEVILKARLVREHWTLALSQPDNASQQGLISGEVKTVTPDQAIGRLGELVNPDLMRSASYRTFKEQLTHIFKYRNRAAHFSLSQTSEEAIKAQLVNAIAFMLEFFGNEWPDRAAETADLTRSVSSLQDVVEARMASLKNVLTQASAVVRCPTCLQEALAVDKEEVRCHYCHYQDPEGGEGLADEYVEECLGLSSHLTVTYGGEWPVAECPECGKDALVFHPTVLDKGPDPEWLCFGCGEQYSEGGWDQCGDCGRIMPNSGAEGVGRCSNCIVDLMGRD